METAGNGLSAGLTGRIQQIFEQIQVGERQEETAYLVRGAKLSCSCGTHKRKVNLPQCHGVYVAGNPLVHEEDCAAGDGENIPPFGICQSGENPANQSWAERAGEKILAFLSGKEDDGPEKIMLQTEDGQNVKGYACTPCIVGGWKDVHKEEKIARNGTDGTKESDMLAALTMKSFLVCAYGGLIEPVTSGQEEE